MSGETSLLLEAALNYARRGWAVFPCHSTDAGGNCSCGKPGCASAGKHPRTAHGLKDATTDEATIREWWAASPDANVAINMGASGLVGIDIDTKHGQPGDETWHAVKAELGVIEDTVIVETPNKGLHLWYRTTSNRIGCDTNGELIGSGVDVKGEGGYLLVPPSSIAGVEYVFALGHGPERIGDLPPALAERLAFAKERTGYGNGKQAASSADPREHRNDFLTAQAGFMRRQGMPAKQIFAALVAINAERYHNHANGPLPEAEVRAIAHGMERYAPPPAEPFKLTELGNAERLAARHGKHLAAVRGAGLKGYEPRRGVFAEDHGALVRYATETVRSIYAEAAACEDERTRKELGAHARKSESKHAVDAMLYFAASLESLQAEVCDFDADPELLNVTNGVVNLRSGELCDHSPDRRMTKIAGAAHDPSASAPLWRAHLERIFAGDSETIAFLQRLFGYAMTGRSNEQVFAVFHGDGANGKGVTINAWRAALGDYAEPTPMTTFSPHKTDAVRNDLARLASARLVTASERRAGQTMDEAVIKELTGNDPITARFLHKEFFTYMPQFLIVLSTNHKPRIECPDYAIKRRVLLVPFEVTIPEEQWDRHLGEKLRAESDGILAWGVQGAADYLASGLRVPERVRAATAAYQAQMDPLFSFAERCTFEPSAWTSTANIRAAIKAWACEEDVKDLPDHNSLAAWLAKAGCEAKKHGGARGWRGVRCEGVESVQTFGTGE
jgi:putative DNA primase/helicase